MKRYTVTLGAPTTAGGKVITASSTISICGAKVALEGDSVFCPACKSEGKIRCDGPRLREFFGETRVSLGGDLCMCACAKPPRLIATQTMRSHDLEGEEAEAWATEFEAEQAIHGGDATVSRRQGKAAFVNERSDTPMGAANYATVRRGSKVADVTDANGHGEL